MPLGPSRGSQAGFFESHSIDINAIARAATIATHPPSNNLSINSSSQSLTQSLAQTISSSPIIASPLRLLSLKTMTAKHDDDEESLSNVPLLGVESSDSHKQLRSRFFTNNKSEPHSPAADNGIHVFNQPINESIINNLKASSQSPNPQAHASFVSLLSDEIQRINSFILQQLSEQKLQFHRIDQQSMRLSSSSSDILIKQPFTSSDASTDSTLDPTRASYVDLYKQLLNLQSFAVTNYQTFLSIVSSYSLFSQSEQQQFESMIESLEIAHNREIITFAEHIESVYAELSITSIKSQVFDNSTPSNQSINLAVKRSQARAMLVSGQRNPTSWSTFDRGFRLGITLLLFFWVIWDCVVDAKLRPTAEVTWVASVLPVYRGIGVALLLGWGWGCNLYIWSHFKINYVALLDLDPVHPVTYTDVFDEVTEASLMFLGNFLLYFKVLRGDFPAWIPAGYFPVALFLYMVYKVIPLRPSSGRQRRVMWTAILKVITSPFTRVTFLTVYTGDILTSLVKPIIDWAYTLCFLFTLEWTDARVKDEICFQSPLFNYGVVPLLSALPLWFRFMQCLKRYTETHQRWPHLANAGKYALAHSVVLFGVFHHSFTDPKSIDTYRIYWICALIVSSLYSYSWDIFMDFGLGSSKHGGLRESQMYSSKWVYYSAIVADLFLRFAWSLTLVPRGDNAPFAPSIIIYLQPLLAVGEVLRRSMWGALRLEWEHIQTLGYKKLDSPPAQKHPPSQSSDRTGWQIILEVTLITLTVLSIALFAAVTAT